MSSFSRLLVKTILFSSGATSYLLSAQNVAKVRVTPHVLVNKPVTHLLYGNFVESGFGRQVDGMWAEMLFNRSFEHLPPSKGKWLQYAEGEDLTTKPWWHSGYEQEEWHLLSRNGEAELRITDFTGFHHGKTGVNLINRSSSEPAYLVQYRLYIRSWMTYQFRGFFRRGSNGTGLSEARIGVGLYPGQEVLTPASYRESELLGDEWFEFSTKLPNAAFQGFASLAISVPPETSVILDDLSLMPADHMDGWRQDVIQGLRRVRPSIIRFPGGCYASFYDWSDGIGPRSSRRPKESDFWGGLEYNDVGTDEFLNLCRLIEAEPLLVVNMMTSSPREAADWVAYCNAPVGHPMGRLRAENGHPEPYGVKYWELDNETYRKWSATDYAKQAIEFAKAMKAVDDSIQLVACGYGRFALSTEQLLSIAGQYIDLISDRAKGEVHLQKKLSLLRDYGRRNNRKIRLCNTEWLAPWGEVPLESAAPGGPLLDRNIPRQEQQITWRYAMNAARTLLMFQRLGGDFEFANFNNMANTWGQNVIECPKEPVFLSATGHVFQLLSHSPAAWPLEIDLDGPTPNVVVQAAWSQLKDQLVLVILNYEEGQIGVEFDLSALSTPSSRVTASQLYSSSLRSYNSISEPHAINRKDMQLELPDEGHLKIPVPQFSLTHILVE